MSVFFKRLENAVCLWEKEYLLTGTIDGTVNYVGPIAEKQQIAQNMLIAYVIPDKQGEITGWCTIADQDAHHVKVGDRCLVTVDRFPSEDFGNLDGRIARIGNFSLTGGRIMVRIIFPDKLMTNIGRNIECRGQLHGTVSIIVRDRRALDIVIQPIKQFWHRCYGNIKS